MKSREEHMVKKNKLENKYALHHCRFKTKCIYLSTNKIN